ncbi:MAG TPA: histidine kinase, partial [Draconibacterium sp.]|nr:histidine kinase [Draconibacterium sp.]
MKRYCLILLSAFVVLSTSVVAQHDLSEKEVKNIVEQYFIIKDIPTRYYSNILIRMDGKITPEDSLFVNRLISKLDELIGKWEVSLIREGTSNLILSVNQPQTESYPQERLGNRRQQEIILRREPINIPEGTPQTERNKILYFKVMKSLVKFSKAKELSAITPQTVFVLDKPEEVAINNPIDFQIIKEIYSKEYDNKLDGSPKNPVKPISRNRQFQIIASMLATIVSTLFLLWMFLLGIFKNHNYIFSEYLKQGMIVLLASTIGILISIFIPAFFMITYIANDVIHTIGPLIVFAFAMIILGTIIILILYFLEKLISKKNKTLFLQVTFPFLTTLLVPSVLLFSIMEFVTLKTKTTVPTIDRQNLMLAVLSITMSVAIYRAFFIFFTKKSESIINQKDVELARMSELHRKAELQSLRAKINPHFLYNSLNSIASLASIDTTKTEQMALSLSDFFKYSINREQKQTNPLSEELK